MHIPSFKRVAIAACAVAALVAAPAQADPLQAQLRVHGPDGKTLDPGNWYLNDSSTFRTATSCGGSGERTTVEGATALGLLNHAADYNVRLDPVAVSDEFDFGLFVCGIGDSPTEGEAFWGYRVNHAVPEVGADQYPLEPFDTVTWAYTDFAAGVNSGNELLLQTADDWVKAGKAAEVRILEFDAVGEGKPAAGVRVGGETTDENGEARIVFDEPGRPVVQGRRGSDIPTQPKRFCVWEKSKRECDTLALGRVVGTDGDDVLKAGSVPEFVVGRRGDDRINIRDGGVVDVVDCGPGDDRVVADKKDRVRPNCDTVTRK